MNDWKNLSKNEQNKTLSAKKKNKKQTFKMVLNSPIPDNFLSCRVLDDENLHYILKSELPSARLAAKDETRSTAEDERAKEIRSHLCLGVNAVGRELRKRKLAAVLLAPEASLKVLLGHVVALGRDLQVPTARVSKLREITSECLGFECIALGVRKDAGPFEIIVDHIGTPASVADESEIVVVEPVQRDLLTMETDVKTIEPVKKVVRPSDTMFVRKEFVLKKRENLTERIFKPNQVSETKMDVEFIDLNDTVDVLMGPSNKGSKTERYYGTDGFKQASMSKVLSNSARKKKVKKTVSEVG